jgi:signal transduction histidine kinase
VLEFRLIEGSVRTRKGSFGLSLIGGLIILALDIYGFVLLRSRPGLPREFKSRHIVRVDGTEIEGSWDIPFLLVGREVGDPVTLVVNVAGTDTTVETRIIAYYSLTPYLITYLVVGLFAVAAGGLCFFLKYEDRKVRIFYWLSLAFASPIILGGCFRLARKEWLSLAPGFLFCVSYAFVIPLLLLFLLEFSSRPYKTVRRLALAAAVFFSLVLCGSFLWGVLTASLEAHRSIHLPVYAAFRFFTVVLTLLTIWILVSLFKSIPPGEAREPFKWIILGLVLSFGPYFVLYQIPSILTPSQHLVTDEVATLFFIFAPLSFALAIFKFKLIKFELDVRRSLVYSILTVFTVGLYMFSVQIFNQLFVKWLHVKDWGARAAGVLLAAAAFRPAQSRIQKLVDKAFFRQSYDTRRCLKSFAEGAGDIVERERLLDFFLETLDSVLPLERRGICLNDVSGDKAEIYLESGDCADLRDAESACLETGRTLSTRSAAGPSEGLDFTKEDRLLQTGWEMIIPLVFKASSIRGILGLGLKKSEQAFSREDLDLVDGLADELAIQLERIRLHEEVVIERTSREKLDELNRLKTEFISTFSHELRTPMSSIQSLAEMLGSGKITDAARREELLGTISAESGRLSRMIHNILDFGKIEHEAKTFIFRKTDIRDIVQDAADVFRHELEARGFTAAVDLPDHPVVLEADRDALKQCLINLIDNAMKYSAEIKEIGLRLLEEAGRVEILVWDKGIGIPEEEREKIFEEFHRVPRGARLNPKGVGLGLKIVKHIVESHGGRILVEGRAGGGSVFRLIFPKP